MGSAGLSRFALLLLLGLLVSCGMAAGQDAWGEDEKPWGKDEKQFEDLTKSSATLPATCNGVIGHGEWHSAWLRVIFPGAPDVHSQHWVLRLVPADFKKTKADETALWALWQALGDKEDTSPSNEAGDYGSDVIITYGEVAEWSKHFVKPMTCTAPRGKFELRYYPNPTPLGDLKCPPPPVKESECSSTNNGSKVTTETEWKMMANSRYQRLRKIIEAPAEALARAPPMALWNAWAFSRLAEMAALGKTVGEADGAGSPIVWVRGYIEGGGEAAFGPPKWRIVVVQKRFETNLGKWVKGARSQAGKGGQAVVNAMKSAAESVRNYHEMGKAHRMIHPKNMLAHVVDTGKVEVVLGNLMGIVERVQAILQTDPVQEPVQPNLQTSSSNSCEEEELIRGGWQDVTRGGRAVADLGSPCSVKNYYSAYPVAVDFYSAMGGDTESRPLEYIDPAAVTRFNARGDRWQSGDVTYQQSDVWSVGVMVLKMLKQFFTDTAGDNDTEAADTIKAVDEVLRVELRAEDDSAMALQKWATKSSCSRSWGDSVRGFLSRNRHHALLDNKLSAALDPTSQGAGGFLPKPKAENASSEKGKALATFLRDGLLRYSLTCDQHSRDLTRLIDALETLSKAWGKADSDNLARARARAFLERSATAFDSEVVSAPAAPAPIDTEGAAAHPSPGFRGSRARDFPFGAEEAAVSTGTTTSEQLTGRRDFLSAQHSQESTVHADEEALAGEAITNCC